MTKLSLSLPPFVLSFHLSLIFFRPSFFGALFPSKSEFMLISIVSFSAFQLSLFWFCLFFSTFSLILNPLALVFFFSPPPPLSERTLFLFVCLVFVIVLFVFYFFQWIFSFYFHSFSFSFLCWPFIHSWILSFSTLPLSLPFSILLNSITQFSLWKLLHVLCIKELLLGLEFFSSLFQNFLLFFLSLFSLFFSSCL